MTTQTADYTVQTGDGTIFADAGSSAITVTLPSAVAGRTIKIKKIDTTTNDVIIVGVSGATIDGAANRIADVPYQYIELQSDGTNWYVMN